MRSFILVMVCAACGGSANVAGMYSVVLTNHENGCSFNNWTVGGTADVMVTITQSGADASADVGGVARVFLDAGFGGHVYTGNVDGNDVDLDLFGMRSMNMGNCAFTYNSTILGTLSVDTLAGEIHYTAATNGNPDCATLQGCLTVQAFNGVRAPP
jgi:hypothetical protein